jgi:diguanylate cyclase (GGDEF)-like protein
VIRHFTGPTSIRSRFVLLGGVVTVIAICLNTVVFVSSVGSDERSQNTVATSVALDEEVAALRDSLRLEDTALHNFLADPDEVFHATSAQARLVQTTKLDEIQGNAAENPAVQAALKDAERAVAAWWTGFADPARSAGGSLAPGSSPAPGASPDLATRGHDLFGAVETAVDRLAVSFTPPDAVLLASKAQNGSVHATELAVSIITLMIAFAVFILFSVRWIFRPVGRILGVVATLRAGGTATFPTSQTEIGQLGSQLDRMYRAMAADAAANNVVNRFVERVIMEETDQGVSEGLMIALDELLAPDRITVHVSNEGRDRAVLQARKGDIDDAVVSLVDMERCPGVRRSVLYPTQDATDRQTVTCPLFAATSGTVVHIPLQDRESVGAVHLSWDEPNHFDPSLEASMHRLVDHASLSISNRRMVAGLQVSASTDARTGLLNSRAFDDMLEQALRDAPAGAPCAVLMFDLDDFKDYNDRFGHAVGDEALRIFAGVLQSHVRAVDIVARYGGEEFIAYLPNIGLPIAADVADRIRRATEQAVIPVRSRETSHITVSVGVATAPTDGIEPRTLVKAADRLLYVAKEAGRNRVAANGWPVSETSGDAADSDEAHDIPAIGDAA